MDWKQVHGRLVALAKRKAAYDLEEGEQLLRADAMKIHLRFGYGSFYEYAERLFGGSGPRSGKFLSPSLIAPVR